jgi:hypothetical protein
MIWRQFSDIKPGNLGIPPQTSRHNLPVPQNMSILKVSDDEVQHPELLGFWSSSIVRYSKN